MTTDQPAGSCSWLEARAVRNASDMVLGGLLLVIGAPALLATRGLPPDPLDYLPPAFFTTVVAGLLAGVGAMLFARGALGRAPHMRWRAWQILPVVALVMAVPVGIWLDGAHLPMVERKGASLIALLFGPGEYVAAVLLVLSVALALARLSRLRAAGMVLLGLLLSVVGEGEPRLTMGVDALAEGFAPFVVAAGLLLAADGLVGLFSPALLLATYTRRIAGWRDPAVSTLVAVGMRAVAALVVAASFYLVWFIFERVWDVGLVLLFGVLGVACKLLGWSRLVLLLGLVCGPLLDERLTQAMVISRGHLDGLWVRPLGGALLLAAGGILIAALSLSLHRALTWNDAGWPRPRGP